MKPDLTDTHRVLNLSLETIRDDRGALVVVEEERLPFRIWSVGWASHAPGADRTGESPKHEEAVVTAVSGSFEITVGSVGGRTPSRLDRRDAAWHVPSGVPWSIENPSADALSLVIATTSDLEAPEPDPLMAPTPIQLPTADCGGWSMTWADSNGHVPFRIRRVYYVHGVPAGATRGGHAHRELQQVIVAVAGSFELILHDGSKRTTFGLDRPDVGIYIPKGIWRELAGFSPGAVCLVLASLPFREDDYVWDFACFRSEARAGRSS